MSIILQSCRHQCVTCECVEITQFPAHPPLRLISLLDLLLYGLCTFDWHFSLGLW
jgi:hypothetical protein